MWRVPESNQSVSYELTGTGEGVSVLITVSAVSVVFTAPDGEETELGTLELTCSPFCVDGPSFRFDSGSIVVDGAGQVLSAGSPTALIEARVTSEGPPDESETETRWAVEADIVGHFAGRADIRVSTAGACVRRLLKP